MAKYLIDAKKNIDSILFIEENIDKVCNLNLNLKEKLAEERKEKAEYAKKVGQLTMQVDWLKKIWRNLWTRLRE